MKSTFAIILCLWASLAQAGGLTQQISGAWRGVGVQDGAASWLIKLDMGTLDARAGYPDFPCGAIWTFGPVSGRQLTAIERLSYGEALCVNNSILVIESPSNDQLIVQWTDPDGVETGFAVLHRDAPALNDRTSELAATNRAREARNLAQCGQPVCQPATS